MGQTPILVLKEGTERETGKGAQFNNIAAAKAIADAVRTTLGPKGMDKMLVDSMGDVTITNDGVTILKELDVTHPAAKMVIEAAKTQDEECKDGTTSAVIIAGELLKRSEELVEQNVHPTIITDGFRMASTKASEVLESISEPVTTDDRPTLIKIAQTAMTGKSSEVIKDQLAEIAVDSILSIYETRNDSIVVDLDNLKVEKKQGGSISDTRLIDGIILDKERVHSGMPMEVKDARVALVNTALEVKKTEVDAKIEINDPTQLQAFLDEEERMIRGMVEKIKATGANVVICQKGIDDLAQHFMSKAGIFAIRRAKKSDMEKLAKATGARIVNNLSEASSGDLGKAERVYEEKISGDSMTFVTGCDNARSKTVFIRGSTEHVVDELERNLNDALGVVGVALEDGKMTIGGGSAAMELAREIRKYGNTVGGREQLAIDAFAAALEIIPRTLAENAGLDSINSLIDLRKAHADGKVHAGLNVMTGEISDMKELNVLEPIRVGYQAIQSATDTSIMILRIDDVIASQGGAAPPGAPPGGVPPGMGGMGGMDY